MQNIYEVIFSHSDKMREIKRIIDEIAESRIAVLIKGEIGTGKELLAQAIHLNSQRKHKPFVKVDCAAMQKGVLQIKLLELEQDPLTGTYSLKVGKFEMLDGGTILLNNISEIDIPLQVRLLQVLQNGMFSHPEEDGNGLGCTRLIATTTDRLAGSMMERYFSEGLFSRINFININIPPLRDRKEQILPLTEYYLNFYKQKHGREVAPFSSKLTNDFLEYAWPGNIRELESVVERIVIDGKGEPILQNLSNKNLHEEIGLRFYENSSENPSVEKKSFSLKNVREKVVQAAEGEIIQSTLRRTHWNRRQAAKLLDINYNTLLYKIQKYNLRG